MELISCRNLLIYFTAPLQQRVLANFAYALRNEGTLILGTSERLGPLAQYFGVLDEKHKIYCRRANAMPYVGETPDGLTNYRAALHMILTIF